MAVGSSNSFDLVVLGAGTGGYAAAFRAAQLGMRVALIDRYKIGGTCLHVGCIPTKCMLESADLYDRTKRAADFGITTGALSVDAAVIARRRQAVVDRLHKGLQALVKKHKVEYIHGQARLKGHKVVEIELLDDEGNPAGIRSLDATDVILASGSRVKSLPGLVPDGTSIVTSDDILKSDRLPASLIVVGAGAVGVEFASYYADMGTKVTVLEYLPSLVPLEDREIGKELERSFKRRGIDVMTSARFDTSKVEVTKQGVCLMVGPEGQPPAELRAEQMLVATGRAANIEDVGLETTRAKVEKGVVQVDPRTMRTAEPHLYAIGDVIGGLWLAHVAAHEGLAAVGAISNTEAEAVDYLKMPRATYSRPQIASIGRSEQDCEREGIAFKTGKFPWLANGKALIGGDYEGFVKVIADRETDVVLGVHMIGPHVTDLIAEASAAMLLDATAWELGAAVHPHPTLSEALGEAATLADGWAINF
ncbi:MAG TPA: dihydrolipoyl dehydrogenase [Candidatus Baltobacteraceae bacterium]|nr:dihydrolipoyl dehydrogenase [Candidatus Baltobacteraceae bacterium]